MKTASALYKAIRVGITSWYEWRVLQGENIYGMDTLKSITVNASLASESGIGIGNANSTECRMTLLEQSINWERMARFTVQFRISNDVGTTKSEWITFGTFYTDERYEDQDGNLSIIAFDGMLKLEQSWTDKIPDELLPSSYPITARAWGTIIQTVGLATFEDITQLDDTVAFIGLNTKTTVRDVLRSIATVQAGNWMMSPDEALRLVYFENVTDEEPDKYVDLGLSAQQFENSPALQAVTGVHLETESGVAIEAGDDTGYMIKAECEFANTTGVPELCLSGIQGYVYQPFTATTLYCDPIVDIGDSAAVNNVIYQVMSLDWTMAKTPTADVSAPYDNEIDHEYTIVSEQAKQYRKSMAAVDERMSDYVLKEEFSTEIVQNADSINLVAQQVFVTKETYDAQIAEIQSQLDGSIQSWSGNAVPTLNNEPAVNWTTTGEKAEHVGDTYFVNSDAGIPEAGSYYRFENNNGVYSWQLLNDSALTEALAKASAALAAAENAQDVADASMTEAQLKGRIFVVQPTPPYDVGDLWFNSTESVIKVCMTARESGSFVDSDWVKRDKYTDDSALNQFLTNYNTTIASIQEQLDQKAETFYQSADPSIDWGAHPAGIAIAGLDVVGIPAALAQSHIGDLWYNTTDNTTWYWDGSSWVQQDIPTEVFDAIDGKAQIFVNTPFTPYSVGDLWFNSASSDILTCMVDRATGDYVASDWQKRNKYTDDTKANAVDTALTQFKSEFTVQPNQIKAEVEKRVIRDKSETKTTFGWLLNDTSHTWYSGNQEVMKVDSSGLTVKGNITATTGYIGNGTSGFTIGSTSIYNGVTRIGDTSHNGIYLGTDGIVLGKGVFKVTNTGDVTASSGTIGGFTLSGSSMYTNGQSSYSGTGNGIYIGSSGLRLGSKFKVDTAGNVTMNNLTANDLVANNAVLKGTLKIYNNSGTSYDTIGSGDLYTGAYQSANNYTNWNGTYSTVNSNGGNWTSAYNSACVSGGYSYDGAGYGYTSHRAFESDEQVTYINTLYLKVGNGGNFPTVSTDDLYLGYGGSRFHATFHQSSPGLNHSSAFQVKDTNGNTQWVANATSATFSPSWVVGYG